MVSAKGNPGLAPSDCRRLSSDGASPRPRRPVQTAVDGRPTGRLRALEGHEGVVKLLLGREDVDPNHPDGYDRTPLGCAAAEGHQGVVKLLLEQKSVDPIRPDKRGGTPLSYATSRGYREVVRLLQDRISMESSDEQRHHIPKRPRLR